MGMKAAIIWFKLDNITHTFLDSGKYDKDRQKEFVGLIQFF
jgi:hypothetical protein